tara:strand:- start:750 stop:1400 length:651 start_codon:yes stop_codon:yes gene_type:complete
MFKKPLVLVNFKTYKQGSGKNAVKVAKFCQKVNGKVQMGVAVQAVDIAAVVKAVRIPVFAQHIDVIDYGSHTGQVLGESVKEAGAVGVLINHSEHRIPIKVIKETVAKAKKLGLITVVCAKTDGEGRKLSRFKSDYVAVEPPSLIGDPNKSVCGENPSLITNSVKKIGKNVLVGAGVKDDEDLRVALGLGAKGVLLASHIMKAKNPLKELKKLVRI